MKFLGNNRTVTSRRGLSFSAYLGLGSAAVLAAAVSISACIPAGDCTGDCADATSGGASGSSGSGGGGGSQGGSGGGGTDVLGKSVSNCNDFPTIGDVETKLIKPKCGDPSGCHGTSGVKFAPELKTANAFERLFDKATSACVKDKFIDAGDFAKSGILVKLQDVPKCGDGTDFGAQMPSGGKTTLTAADKTCLEEYVKAVIAAKKM
jgi:hypothetical protein